ncbi:MAG TPA: hypothetical protein PLQ93_02845 [Bacteroidia bacterium]|nr:hypothetical protein [Bacteroidia bacterium]
MVQIKRIYRTLAISGLLILLSFSHPFYLSVTDLNYNIQSKTIRGTVKMFSNDLEDALRRLEKKHIDLLHPSDESAIREILGKYLKSRLTLEVNTVKLNYEVLGFETEEENIRIYLESTTCEKPGRVKIEDSLLYDFLKEQMNIVNFEMGAQIKSLKVNNPEKSIEFQF